MKYVHCLVCDNDEFTEYCGADFKIECTECGYLMEFVSKNKFILLRNPYQPRQFCLILNTVNEKWRKKYEQANSTNRA